MYLTSCVWRADIFDILESVNKIENRVKFMKFVRRIRETISLFDRFILTIQYLKKIKKKIKNNIKSKQINHENKEYLKWIVR